MRRPAIDWNLLLHEMDQLQQTDLSSENFSDWIKSWSHLAATAHNDYSYWLLTTHQNCTQEQTQLRFHKILAERLPMFEQATHKLIKKLLSSNFQHCVPQQLQQQFKKRMQNSNKKQMSLKAKELFLIQEYQRISSQQLVKLERPCSFTEANILLAQSINQQRRQEIWQHIQTAKMSLNKKTAGIFIQLIQIRNKMAKNAGYASYIEFIWDKKDIADYAISEAQHLIEKTAAHFISIRSEINIQNKKWLKLQHIQPWNLSYHYHNDLAQKHHTQDDAIRAGTGALGMLDSEFAEIIQNMSSNKNIDLTPSINKSNHSYTTYYAGMNEQFVVGDFGHHFTDINTILKAFGEAIHFHDCNKANTLFWMKEAPTAVSYFVASTFQALGIRNLSTLRLDFLNSSSCQQLQDTMLQHSSQFIEDLEYRSRFEHWIYQNIDQIKSAHDLNQAYLELCPPFEKEWEGFEQEWSLSWNDWLTVSTPLESIDRLIAWISTMLFLKEYDSNRHESLVQFKALLSLGNTTNVQESLQSLGISLPFTEQDLQTAKDIFLQEYKNSSFTPVQNRNAI